MRVLGIRLRLQALSEVASLALGATVAATAGTVQVVVEACGHYPPSAADLEGAHGRQVPDVLALSCVGNSAID
jgi:hypothetical protein